ncbi:hydrogen gas-evolving membrane-bound hydrogenase subunit E [Mycobacterium sp. SMC-4]|uniref:hydrogen gas-evolving membrane-bound hydrogenase subunit E n=1 Tax=Mycobacterium sp. SMC-4 TaxID=2857059 RepID=UPI0021B28984|nr:hydrogen gas-evolving membrane-bound hydrogenase subunit E [Mycobacterium sp. SMC-4]UXA18601.1 DUF4040 domain-containing protein [Mycobacterium sp. SMC-4]
MNSVAVLDIALGGGVLVAAWVTLLHPDRIASVTMFLGMGVLLVGVWARLGAPDVALAEAALAAGVTGALLVAAVARDNDEVRIRRAMLTGQAVLVLAAGALLAVVLIPAAAGPVGDQALARQATASIPDAAVSHPVTAVLLDFRAYDTLLEVVVLAVAAVAALSLHPRGSLRTVDTPVDRRPTVMVLLRVLGPVLVLLAAWLLVAGSSRPGGAFQSGAVVAGLLILALLTSSVRVPAGPVLRLLIVAGAAVFVALAAGTATLTGWLTLEEPWAGTAVVAVEAVLAVSIGVALAALLVAQEPSR